MAFSDNCRNYRPHWSDVAGWFLQRRRVSRSDAETAGAHRLKRRNVLKEGRLLAAQACYASISDGDGGPRHAGEATVNFDSHARAGHNQLRRVAQKLLQSHLVKLPIHFGPVPHRRLVFANANTLRAAIGR